MFSTFIVMIATFDLIPTENLDSFLYYLPEEQPFNMHFQNYGYDSRLVIGNMGLALYIIYLYLFLGVIILLTFCLSKKLFYTLSPLLFWNGFIRLFMEAF